MQGTTSPGNVLQRQARQQQAAFLLEEYRIVSDSMLRNEESGEKRAAFFLSLAGAAGAVVAFAGDKGLVRTDNVPLLTAGVSAVLLFLGLMTIRRLAERHIVTDRQLFALRDIRRTFVDAATARAMPNAFRWGTYEPRAPRQQRFVSFHKGGWMECVAAVNAILFAACVAGPLARATPGRSAVWLSAGVLSAIGAWMAQITLATGYVATESGKLQGPDATHIEEARHEKD